jgi:hypothetical protein
MYLGLRSFIFIPKDRHNRSERQLKVFFYFFPVHSWSPERWFVSLYCQKGSTEYEGRLPKLKRSDVVCSLLIPPGRTLASLSEGIPTPCPDRPAGGTPPSRTPAQDTPPLTPGPVPPSLSVGRIDRIDVGSPFVS